MSPSEAVGAAEVVVVGSLNLDLSVRVNRFPDPGETVVGTDLVSGGGGKGANQAVAASRLGRRVAMVGAVGDDDAGRRLLSDLDAFGVSVSGVVVDDDNPTGTALIEVDDAGENRIVVVAGANGALNNQALDAASVVFDSAKVVLTQFETPVELIQHLPRLAPSAVVIVNPAPALVAGEAESVLGTADFVVPNRHELAALDDGVAAVDRDAVVLQAGRVLRNHDRLRAVVVTLGVDGVVVVDRDAPFFIPAVAVTAVDTTAAGDAFCGGFADGLLASGDPRQAASWAVRVAACAVTRQGAQASLPTRDDVLAL